MKNNFYVFGDSFFDENMDSEYDNSWLINLKKDKQKTYNFFNYAKKGTGPHYLFKMFNKLLTNSSDHFLKNDVVLIHLSGGDRIDFVCSPELFPYISNIKYDYANKKSYCLLDKFSNETNINSESKKVQEYYKNFRSEIEFFYMNMQNEILFMGSKYISYLYAISRLYDIKVIVFCSELIHKFKLFFTLNDEKFFCSDINLFDASFDELIVEHKIIAANKVKIDNRINHFSPENHEILLQYIDKILKCEYKNLPKLKNNFKRIEEIYSYISDDNKDYGDFKGFIYE